MSWFPDYYTSTPPNQTAVDMAISTSQQRIHALHHLLASLRSSSYPSLASPPETDRRASVALVIRIKPSYAHWPEPASTKIPDLDAFFQQEWVQHGEAEILFIKRASRKGDRWTSHIALPGGKLDPTDASDYAAAVRECEEEVGLNLDETAIPVGNLPQRLVTTHWGKKALLVLCPYIFLLTHPAPPPLRLQPTEVAATHWVPIRSLQDPQHRTVAFEDVSARLANQETGTKRWMLSLILGRMTFAAISLLPTESLHSAETPILTTLQDNRHTPPTLSTHLHNTCHRIKHSDLFNSYPPLPPEAPLLLWGLTLGVLSDFLDLTPPHNALTLWTYPTFTPLDVRLIIWLATYNFKARKRAELQAGMEPAGSNTPYTAFQNPAFGTASESLASAAPRIPIDDSTVLVDHPADETGFHGLGTGLRNPALSPSPAQQRVKKAAVATMLQGCVDRVAETLLPHVANRARYYDVVRKAVLVALVVRGACVGGVGWWVWRRYLRTRRVR